MVVVAWTPTLRLAGIDGRVGAGARSFGADKRTEKNCGNIMWDTGGGQLGKGGEMGNMGSKGVDKVVGFQRRRRRDSRWSRAIPDCWRLV